jgi:hypothetical protein
MVMLIASPSLAQMKLIRKIDLKDIRFVTIDRGGDVYAVTSDAITKFDKDGKQLSKLSITDTPESFDTGNGVRLLSYDRGKQKYTILTPSLGIVNESTIDSSIAIDAFLFCSSGDYGVLILDAADWSIKKMDTRDSRVLSEFKIDSLTNGLSSFASMREYQNFIFLLDKNGISIFNGIGMKIRSISIPDLKSFNFLGQELYYYVNGQVHFFDLFTTETRFEDIPGFDAVLLTDERLVGIKTGQLEIYSYHPQ